MSIGAEVDGVQFSAGSPVAAAISYPWFKSGADDDDDGEMMAMMMRAMHFNCNLLELHAATTIPIKLDGGASGRVIYDDPPPSLTCTDLSATAAVYATHCCGHISTVPDIVMRWSHAMWKHFSPLYINFPLAIATICD